MQIQADNERDQLGWIAGVFGRSDLNAGFLTCPPTVAAVNDLAFMNQDRLKQATVVDVGTERFDPEFAAPKCSGL